MLQKLRNLTNTIFVKLIICLLVLSFALWGIGDIFRSKLTEHIAKVGGFSVSKEYLDYRTEILRNQYSQYFNDADINPGLIQNIALRNIIREKVVDFEAKNLGYKTDNELVFSVIRNDSNFLDEEGKFSQIRFRNYLLSNNVTEKMLFNNLSKDIISNIINDSFTNNSINFPGLQKLESNFINEERTVSLIKIKIPKVAPDTGNPTESELLDMYSKYKEDYIFPETRDFQMITFGCKQFLDKANIDDASVKAEYEQNIDKYQIPEKRKVRQLFSKSEELIKKAYDDLVSGEDFIKISNTLDMKDKDVNLGLLSKNTLYANFVEPVFGANISEYTTPIKGPFGWHIFQIDEIKKGKKLLFSDVKKEIFTSLQKQKACNLASEYFSKAEDDIAAGVGIEDIAKNYNLTVEEISKIKDDSFINGQDDNAETSEKLYKIIFTESDINKVKSQLLGNENFIVYNLKQVNEQRYLTIDEIKGALSERWKKEKHQEKYQNIADDVYNNIKGNEKNIDYRKLKTRYNLHLSNIDITRENDILPIMFTEDIFKLSDNSVSDTFYDEDNHQYLIAVMKTRNIKKISAGKQMLINETIKNNYLSYFNNSVSNSYFNYLIKKHGVELQSNDGEEPPKSIN